MVFASMHNGDARASGHQTFDDLVSRRLDPCESEDVHHKREDESDGFGLMDNRVVEGRVMHLHQLISFFVE
jgi:hypothetical protein